MKKDRIYTYGDYKTWPDDERWELIDGTAWNMSPGAWPSSKRSARPGPAPNRWHQQYLASLLGQLLPYLEGHPCRVYVLDKNGRYPEDPTVYMREDTAPCTVIEGLSIDLAKVFAED